MKANKVLWSILIALLVAVIYLYFTNNKGIKVIDNNVITLHHKIDSLEQIVKNYDKAIDSLMIVGDRYSKEISRSKSNIQELKLKYNEILNGIIFISADSVVGYLSKRYK